MWNEGVLSFFVAFSSTVMVGREWTTLGQDPLQVSESSKKPSAVSHSICVLGKECCVTGFLRAVSKCLPFSWLGICTCGSLLMPLENTVQQSCQNNCPHIPFLRAKHLLPIAMVTELSTVPTPVWTSRDFITYIFFFFFAAQKWLQCGWNLSSAKKKKKKCFNYGIGWKT